MKQTSRPSKVLLVQLPFPVFSIQDKGENIPLAAGYLKAMAHREGLLDEIEVEILAPGVQDIAGDAALVEAICSESPDVVGFTCYVWNIARTLHIAQRIKEGLPGVRIIAGGPEITASFLSDVPGTAIDIAAIGEGERTFVELLRHFRNGSPVLDEINGITFRAQDEIVTTPSREQMPDVDDIPSPYLLGLIKPLSSLMTIETLRGCANRCGYCQYGRLYPKIRTFSLERLRDEFALAKERRVQRLFLVDPDTCSGMTDRFKQMFRMFAEMNSDKSMILNTCIGAEGIDAEMVRLMVDAHMRYVHVGLQSLNSVALGNVNRKLDLPKFLAGVELLRKSNIRIQVGLIVGLPGETPDTMVEAYDFLAEHDLAYDGLAMPLQVLPGVKLREEAEELGLVFERHAPYRVLKTATMSSQDLQGALDLWHGRYSRMGPKGYTWPGHRYHTYSSDEHSRTETADAGHAGAAQSAFPLSKMIVEIDGRSQTPEDMARLSSEMAQQVGDCLTLWLKCSNPSLPENLALMKVLLKGLSEPNPYTVWRILVESGHPLPKDAARELKSSTLHHRNYLDTGCPWYPRGQEYKRGTLRARGVMDLGSDGADKSMAGCLDGTDCMVSARLANAEHLEAQMEAVFSTGAETIVLDFDPSLAADSVLTALKAIAKRNQNERREICFKNWVVQRIWDVEIIREKGVLPYDELIVTMDHRLRRHDRELGRRAVILDLARFVSRCEEHTISSPSLARLAYLV